MVDYNVWVAVLGNPRETYNDNDQLLDGFYAEHGLFIYKYSVSARHI